MIKIRKCRNQEKFSIRDVSLPFTFTLYVSRREQAEELRRHWEMETHIQPFMEKMETHADEIKSDIFESKG